MSYNQVMFAGQANRTRGDEGPFFQGRNGMGICTGIELMAINLGEALKLTPMSSKGVANCFIEIPVKEVEQVAKTMLDVVGKLPASSQTVDAAWYREHLVSRIFEQNGFGSTQALLAAIRQASELDESTHWRDRKAAFNSIAEAAPMRESSGYLLKYDEVPGFLDQEAATFEAKLGA